MIRQSSSLISSVRNILTLRYDPEKSILEKKLSPRDFKEIEYNDDITQRVESIIKNEINKHIAKMKSITIPMGSGIDSAVVLTLAKEVFPKKNIRAVSLSFNDLQDETKGAEKICSAIGVECHKITIDNVLKDLPLQVSIVNEPRWNLWYYYALEAAKKLHTDAMLTGDGGDELFAGYVFRYSKFLELVGSSSRDNNWIDRAWSYLQCHERDWVPDQHEIFGPKINTFDWKLILKYFKPYFDNDLSKLNQVFLADYNGKLRYDWIPTNRMLSAHFGIKTLSPMLSESMIEYAPHIPMAQKYDAKTQEGKLVLREILAKHWILRYVSKRKMGFGMDLVNLWNKHGKNMAESYLDRPLVVSEGLINKEWLNRTMGDLRKKKDQRYINKILQIISLEIWLRISLKKDILWTKN